MRRRITAKQLAARLAKKHGLEKEHLHHILQNLLRIERFHPQQRYWLGTITNIAAAVRMDLPHEIEQILAKEKRILDSREIAAKLGLPRTRKNMRKLTYGFQLLRELNMATKHPSHSTEHPVATWSHTRHGELEITHPSTSLEIMEALYKKILSGKENALSTTEIARPGKSEGNFSDTAILLTMKNLKIRGLIKAQRKTKPTKRGGIAFHQISLTEKGKRLMKEFYRGKRKSFPELREYLAV